MASKFSPSPSQFHLSLEKMCFLMLIFLPLLLFVLSMKHQIITDPTITRKDMLHVKNTKPVWFDIIVKDINIDKKKIKIGLVNVDAIVEQLIYNALHPQAEITSIHFERVNESLKWNDFFPDYGKYWVGSKQCPKMPIMPKLKNDQQLNVVLAMLPCGKNQGIRDVFGLQVNLVVANLAVENGWFNELDSHRNVYVVFVGSCGPMVEVFRCDDLLMHQGEYWVYKPNLKKLKQKLLMPLGSCQIAPGYSETGNEIWRSFVSQLSDPRKQDNTIDTPKLAYVTVLHSSEAHVCGALVLAQSILLSGRTLYQPIDLLILADESIGPESISGLEAAGWKIKRIQCIRNAKNKGNYIKLRIWQLTVYDKIIFIDSDLLVVKNMDGLFTYPQLSASPNDRLTLFNSGLMIVEPSQCMFEYMVKKISKAQGDDDDDQGFLNEIFTWWHRLPSEVNYLKSDFQLSNINEKLEDVHAIHYLGLKPWMQDHHVIASDLADQLWWQVYDTLPMELQSISLCSYN